MPRAGLEAVAAARAGVADADLGGLDRAVGVEVAALDEVDDVVAVLVGTGDPAGAVDDARVEQVAHAGGLVGAEHAGPDVALDELGHRAEVVEDLVGRGLELRAEALVVDLAVVAGTPMARTSLVPSGWVTSTMTFLRVSPAAQGRSSRGKRALSRSTSDAMVGVSGVSSTCAAAGTPEASRVGHGDADGLDVGGVPAVRAADVGVLAVLGGGEELLALAAAHRAGHRLDDDVVEAEPVEDPDVGLALGVVRLGQTGLVDVEGVSVLHDELAPAQQARAGPRLVAVLRLDLVERDRQVLVGRVEVLDGEGEQLLVRRAEQVVLVLAVLEPEDVRAVLGPAAVAS